MSTQVLPTPPVGPSSTLAIEAPFPLAANAPDTSAAMAARAGKRFGALRAQVLLTIAQTEPAGIIDDQIEQVLSRAHQSVSAARRTLVRDGMVAHRGERRLTRYGNPAHVWHLTWAGWQALGGDETP